jgi:hypothetical protein
VALSSSKEERESERVEDNSIDESNHTGAPLHSLSSMRWRRGLGRGGAQQAFVFRPEMPMCLLSLTLSSSEEERESEIQEGNPPQRMRAQKGI